MRAKINLSVANAVDVTKNKLMWKNENCLSVMRLFLRMRRDCNARLLGCLLGLLWIFKFYVSSQEL